MRIEEQDKNNNNIAQQLHENIAQTLAAIKLHLHSIQHQKKNSSIDQIDDTLSGLIEEVKKLSEQMMPTTFIQDNLLFHLEMLVYQYSLKHPLEIKKQIDKKIKELSLGKSLHIYKIIEDFLKLAVMNNVNKIQIKITYSSDHKIDIEFNGSGKIFRIDQNELLLNDIRTRVDILHGTMYNPSFISEKNICRITFSDYKEKSNSLANIY
jgi:signal transduction histidine kinase